MNLLAIDVGSSSVKLGILRNGKVVGRLIRQTFKTRYQGDRAEVDADVIVAAIVKAISSLKKRAESVDAIAIAAMAPSWLAIDREGNPLTPIVTHQDRRSTLIAQEIEERVGQARHLHIAGNRPVPGGISSTTCAWFLENEPALMKRADLIGHLQTYLLRLFTGERLIDPSNASFTGLYETTSQRGWNAELYEAVGVSPKLLPEVREADQVAGHILAGPAKRLGLKGGIPVLVGLMDTSAAMLLAGAQAGQLVNVVGSTDVLALCRDRARPHPKLLTRALGVDKKWLSVATLAAAGSALKWAKDQLCVDLSMPQFDKLIASANQEATSQEKNLSVQPFFAGDRASIEQRKATISGLTLATTRDDIVRGIARGLAQEGAARLDLLQGLGTPVRSRVMVSGGAERSAKLFHRAWKGDWHFGYEEEATLRGLAKLLDR